MDFFKSAAKKASDKVKQASATVSEKTSSSRGFKGKGQTLGDGASNSVGDRSGSRRREENLPTTESTVAAQAPLDPEKERRRQLQAKSAEDRTSAWNRKIEEKRREKGPKPLPEWSNEARILREGSTSASPSPSPPREREGEPASTRLTPDEYKAREAAAVQATGFNPYLATFSTSAQALAAVTRAPSRSPSPSARSNVPSEPLPSPPTASGLTRPLNQSQDDSINVNLSSLSVSQPSATVPPAAPQNSSSGISSGDALDEHVLAFASSDPQVAGIAIPTIIKVLSNVIENPQETKFSRIRVGNANIQNKIVAIPGALEILLLSGFEQQSLDNEEFLVHSLEPSLLAQAKYFRDQVVTASKIFGPSS